MKTNKTKIQLSPDEMKAETTHTAKGDIYRCADMETILNCSGAAKPIASKRDNNGDLVWIQCPNNEDYDPSNPETSGGTYFLFCDDSGSSGASGSGSGSSSIATNEFDACEGKKTGDDCEWEDANGRQSGFCEYDRNTRKRYCHTSKP